MRILRKIMHEIDPEEIYKEMLKIANKDGIITSDEQQILDNVRQNIEKYYQVLRSSYEDNLITSDEQNSLYQQRKSIMDEALNVAKADEKVTQDEFALLTAIRRLLEDMEFLEHD